VSTRTRATAAFAEVESVQLTERVAEVAMQVERWGHARGWTGSDPYDGANGARIASALRQSPRGRQVVAQIVKRCPVDLRPALGVAPGLSSVTLANVVVAHALGGFLDDEIHVTRLRSAAERLKRLRLDTYDEPAWGYHWDAQSRLMYYPRTEPNGIATAFAAHALLDAYHRLGDLESLDLGLGAAEWFMRRVPRTSAHGGAFFGYLVGDRTPIHNANLLACSLLARAARISGRTDWMTAAAEGVAYTLAHQRTDGGWWYGETKSTRWLDGFHTGYVLDALQICEREAIPGEIDAARRRGVEFYRQRLFLADGTPKYYEDAVYPIDAQGAAQGIQTFALAAVDDRSALDHAVRVFGYAMRQMWRGEGRFLFQRRRLWVNPVPHMRWVQSPMLRALAHLGAALGASA
jgi:hypothetical protein